MSVLNNTIEVTARGLVDRGNVRPADRSRVESMVREQLGNRLRAKYDAAQTTPENEALWASADRLSADAATSASVRKRIRERSRYEAANSSFYAAALETDAAAMIGPGPSKRFFFGDEEVDRTARDLFRAYARRSHMGRKLQLMRKAALRDGEVVGIRYRNQTLPPQGVQTDVMVVECDRLSAPYDAVNERRNVDGVLLNADGDPIRYQILDRHPGADEIWDLGLFGEFSTHEAADVIHYFLADRPGQHRGLPAVTPCLSLFAQFRRYKLAVLTAAETAANLAAVLKLDATVLSTMLDANPDLTSSDLILGQDELFDLVRGSMPAIPAGYSIDQLKAEQPTTTLEMFERVLLREIGRCFGQTYAVLVGDSSNANMSSGNLDERRWWSYLESQRAIFDETVIDRWTEWWWAEQRLQAYALPYAARQQADPRHRTTWSTRFEHNDPNKVASATATYHALGLVSDDTILEQWNVDPSEHYQELEAQVARRKSLGLAPVGPTQQAPEAEPDEDDPRDEARGEGRSQDRSTRSAGADRGSDAPGRRRR
jgi:capsid protein